MTSLLEVRDLRVVAGTRRDPATILDGISFDVVAGRRLGIVGESGSGKSTTALAIMRLLDPGVHVAGGTIVLDETDVLALRPKALRRVRGGEIAMIYQDPMSALNPLMTVGAQIVESLRLHSALAPKAARRRAAELLDDVGVPEAARRLRSYSHELSGGMRQRVMLAIAISGDPRLLIADEPTTALDVTTQARIMDLLAGLVTERGLAMMLITHDLGVAAGFCDELLVLNGGRILERGPIDRVYAEPAHPYTAALLASVCDMATPVDRPLATVAGGPRTERVPVEPPPDREPLVVVDGLVKQFPLDRHTTVRAVDDVSLRIAPGETFGLAGESGSGKSTVSKCLLGLLRPDGGSVRIGDATVATLGRGELRRLRRDVQVVLQDPHGSLNRRHAVRDIIAAPLAAHGIGDKASRRLRVAELLDRVGIGLSLADRHPRELSGGQAQRVAIARALAVQPKFVVLDEAVSALDVSVRAQILNLLRDLQRDFGLTYLFISHDLAVVRYMCQQVAIMQRGRIVESGPRHAIFAQPQHAYTQALLAAVPIADPPRERARAARARAPLALPGGAAA